MVTQEEVKAYSKFQGADEWARMASKKQKAIMNDED